MSNLALAVILAVAALLTGCNEGIQAPMPITDASGNVTGYAQAGDQGPSALETGAAALGGAAIGSMIGNAMSRPSAAGAPVVHQQNNTHTRTIIRERTIIRQAPAAKPRISMAPSRPAYRPSFSRSFSRRR